MRGLLIGTLFLALTSASVMYAQTNNDNPSADLSLGPPPDNDITVVVAVYGGREHYVDVTKQVTKLMGQPESFDPTGYALGIEDPNHGQANYLIIVFDLYGKRHVFTRQNNGDKVNARELKLEAKAEKEPVPYK